MPIRASLLLLCSLVTTAAAETDGTTQPAPSAPRLAVATDPVGLLAGRYALSATYVMSRRLGLRADIEILEEQPRLFGSGGWSAALLMPIYLDRPLQGPYVEPGLALVDRLMGYATAPGIGTLGGMTTVLPQRARSVEPQIFVGWQWLFASRLHIAGAIGVSRHFDTNGSGESFSIPQSYVRVGLAL